MFKNLNKFRKFERNSENSEKFRIFCRKICRIKRKIGIFKN